MTSVPSTPQMSRSERFVQIYGASAVAVAVIGFFARLALAAHPGRDLFEGLWIAFAFLISAGLQCLLLPLPFLLRSLSRHRVRSCILFASWLVVLALSRTSLPLSFRVLLSDPWLRPAARRVLSGTSTLPAAHHLGLFRIHGTSVEAGMACLSTGAYNLFGDAGVVYVPAGHPGPSTHNLRWYRFRHLYGPWWQYTYED